MLSSIMFILKRQKSFLKLTEFHRMLESDWSRNRSTKAAQCSTGEWYLVPIHGAIKMFYAHLIPCYGTKLNLKVIISTNLTMLELRISYIFYCFVKCKYHGLGFMILGLKSGSWKRVHYTKMNWILTNWILVLISSVLLTNFFLRT